MKTIGPKSKVVSSTKGAGPKGAGEMPGVGPGAAAMKTKGIPPDAAAGDKNSAKAH